MVNLVNQSEYLTAAEVASILGCHQNHVSKLAARGVLETALKGPGLRGARFFHRDEVARVAAERNLS